MKIAIIGQNVESKKKILSKFLELCSDYGTFKETIYDEDVVVSSEIKFNEEWNETEKELYKRIAFLTTQMDKSEDKKNVIWVGHSLDVLIETMSLSGVGEVSSDFVEKIIYWNQKLMKKLDLIYWLPDSDSILEKDELEKMETLEGDELDDAWEKFDRHQVEVLYNNIWDDYLQNFDNSVILPRYCPGIGVFETESPAVELADIVQDLHETEDKDTRLEDIAKLDKIIKDKKLLDGMKKVLMQNTIPLPSGERVTSGGISLNDPL